MKYLSLLILLVLVVGCDETTFSDVQYVQWQQQQKQQQQQQQEDDDDTQVDEEEEDEAEPTPTPAPETTANYDYVCVTYKSSGGTARLKIEIKAEQGGIDDDDSTETTLSQDIHYRIQRVSGYTSNYTFRAKYRHPNGTWTYPKAEETNPTTYSLENVPNGSKLAFIINGAHSATSSGVSNYTWSDVQAVPCF